MKKVIITVFLFISVVLSSCSNEGDKNSQNAISSSVQDKSNSITESILIPSRVDSLDTPYTECYRNEDNSYSLFIYAAPIQYYDGSSYKHINNTIVESTKSNTAYENKDNSIKMYFPKNLDSEILISSGSFSLPFKLSLNNISFSDAKLVDYINIYGQSINAVSYESKDVSLFLYPSNYGIEIETVYSYLSSKVPQIILNYNNDFPNHYDNANNGYIALRKGTDFNDIEAIIHSPITGGESTYNAIMEASVEDHPDGKAISYTNTTSAKVINQSIVLYTSNMPDSCAYSEFKKNQYLSRFSYIGTSDFFGEGINYIRYRLDYFMKIDPEKVIRTSYNFKSISSGSITNYSFQENLGQWSSSGLSWRNRNKRFAPIETRLGLTEDGFVSVDITDYSKKCFADETWMTESYGLTMRYTGGYQIVASSDNPMFVPFLKIDLNDLPENFYPMVDINPVIERVLT